jgi:hypothetical protein
MMMGGMGMNMGGMMGGPMDGGPGYVKPKNNID